ncbi:MAG: cyclase family protein [Verrucomicrobia bacterium]|nr:cyclase family protein [Verrucomicrobiota bacterium]MDA1066932.1 cyclase family protein [Verrucomicrobiota bacterium]
MTQIVDLTHAVTKGDRGIDYEDSMTITKNGWNARTWHLYSHSNTHMDAPKHFIDGGDTIDNTPLEVCMGPAWLIDLGEVQARQLHTIADLGDYVDKIQAGDRVILKTGWEKYFGTDTFRDDLPRISKALAEWFVEKKIALLGVEPPSVADVNDIREVTEIHRILLGANITIVESLKNLHRIKQDRFEFIALPLKLTGGDGSPVRALGIV